jgi:tryptophan synthase alpha chain
MGDAGATDLERALRSRTTAGGRAFVPYVTGGSPGVDADVLRALAASGADAIEVGIPFSDPVMDGGVIQEASKRALDAGATPERVLATIREASPGVPVAVMTYFNPVLRIGPDVFLAAAADAGVSGAIVPDLPVDEAEEWIELCAKEQVAPVLLAAPGSDAARLRAIADASGGFVYCVATYGVTGERERLETTAQELVGALRPLTDLPLLVGVGIGTPDQAREACRFADGVIVGSALMRHLVAGEHDAAFDLAAAFRAAVPAG